MYASTILQVTPIIWLIAIMLPINGVVNVGAGILQGALDFTYQVKRWKGGCRGDERSYPHLFTFFFVQVATMGISAVIAAILFFALRDEGLTAVWETLLAFQVIRAVLFAYRFLEPTGPLAVTGRKEPRILMGYSFGEDSLFDKNRGKGWRRRARKKF